MSPKKLKLRNSCDLNGAVSNEMALQFALDYIVVNELVVAKVRQFYQALEFASPRLRQDRNVVLAALLSKPGNEQRVRAAPWVSSSRAAVLLAVQRKCALLRSLRLGVTEGRLECCACSSCEEWSCPPASIREAQGGCSAQGMRHSLARA